MTIRFLHYTSLEDIDKLCKQYKKVMVSVEAYGEDEPVYYPDKGVTVIEENKFVRRHLMTDGSSS
ncbi:MAG: hypothetical protein ACRD8W_12340 [Nitrososphaeraceae archaeon]